MLDWLTKTYLPIGLDIGSTAVRAIQLKRIKTPGRKQGEALEIHSAIEIPFSTEPNPEDEFAEGFMADLQAQTETPEEPQDDQWIQAAEQVFKRADFQGREVIIHCPASRMDMRPLSIPAPPQGLPRQAVLGAIKLKLADNLPFDPANAVYDYFPMSYNEKNSSQTVITFTTDGQWINERIKQLKKLNLQCVAIDTLPCVLDRLCRPSHSNNFMRDSGFKHFIPAAENETDQELLNQANPDNLKTDQKPTHHVGTEEKKNDDFEMLDTLTGILDIGHDGSSLIVSNNNGPCLFRRFHLGGKLLTEALTQRLMIDFNHAEKIKRMYGIDVNTRKLRLNSNEQTNSAATAVMDAPGQNSEMAKTIFAALQSELNDYLEGLIRTLNYAITEYNRAKLTHIVLCGSASHTRNFNLFLKDKFELPVRELKHPLLEQIIANLPSTRQNSGSWTTALGLALAREVC